MRKKTRKGGTWKKEESITEAKRGRKRMENRERETEREREREQKKRRGGTRELDEREKAHERMRGI